MKVLFIIEPFKVELLGMAYLASAIKKAGHEAEILKIDDNDFIEAIEAIKEIKPDYTLDINFLFNETLTMSKIVVDNSTFFDTLNLYCFTMSSYMSEFLFLIAERQNIISKLQKKVVRSSAIQISTTSSLNVIQDFYDEARQVKIKDVTKRIPSDEIIKLN